MTHKKENESLNVMRCSRKEYASYIILDEDIAEAIAQAREFCDVISVQLHPSQTRATLHYRQYSIVRNIGASIIIKPGFYLIKTGSGTLLALSRESFLKSFTREQ